MESEEHTSIVDADHHHLGYLSSIYYGFRSIYIPISPYKVLKSQKKVLSSFVRSPIQHKRYQLQSGEYINYIDIVNPEANNPHPITFVMTHGFGAGLALFFANYDDLATKFARVISFDWLGMGGSSRPSGGAEFDERNPNGCVDFFIDSAMEFISGLKLTSFVLMGHSLGGYLTGRFLKKYPDSGIKGLILLSAAGLRPHPKVEDQVETHELESSRLRWMMSLRSWSYTPQSLVRIGGPFASKYVKQAVVGRFGSDRWSEEQSNMIAEYLYGISALPPCGEYSFNSILLPLAHRVTLQPHSPNSESEIRFAIYARDQLKPQDFILNSLLTTSAPIAAEGSQENESNTASSSSQQKRCSIPILILYGDDDWISFPEVRKYVQEMQSYDVNTTLRIIPHAGHHLYMDNKDEVINSIDTWWTSTGDLQDQRQRPQHLSQQQQPQKQQPSPQQAQKSQPQAQQHKKKTGKKK